MTEIRYLGKNEVEENYEVVKHGQVVDHPDPDRVRALCETDLWELADEKARLPRASKVEPPPEEGG